MTKKNRRRGDQSRRFKAKVALAALRGDKTPIETAQHHGVHLEQVMEWMRQAPWALWFWAIAAELTVLILVALGTAWAVYEAMSPENTFSQQYEPVRRFAAFPASVGSAIEELQYRFDNDPVPLLLNRKITEQPYWIRRFPSVEDPGYLLFSGVDPIVKHSIVQLIRIADGKVVGQWDPDWREINKKITSPLGAVTPNRSRAMHPLLLADGDIIFNDTPAMVRLSPCSSTPVWVIDDGMHHSIELDQNGDIWAPSLSEGEDGLADNSWLREKIQDEALARVSPDGRILEKRSFVRILRDNGLQMLLFGTAGSENEDQLNTFPIHLNQIKVALQSSPYWQRGDLLISSRHMSTVFLYRPSTGKILWYKTGPWMGQHSVDFVDDHRISVFDNNTINGANGTNDAIGQNGPNALREHAFLAPDDINHVYIFDFKSGQLSQPYAELLAQARPMTVSEGRARVLPDGGLFIEETNFGRHLRFTRDRLLWSRVNDYDDQRIGLVTWSRYLTAEEASGPLQALAARKCTAAAQ